MRQRTVAFRQCGVAMLALGLVLLAGVTFAQDGKFSLDRAEISPDKAKPGETVTIRAKVTAKDAASGVHVDLEVKDKDDKKVAQRMFSDQNFSAGQTRTYEWKWEVPRDLAGGDYVAKVGVFGKEFGQPVAWNNEAGRISVQGERQAGLTADDKFDIQDTKIDPGRVKPGQSVRVETKIKARDAADAIHVDLEIKDQNNNKVAQRVFSDQRFDAGQTRTYEWTWKAPDNLPPGDYIVKVGVFDKDWKEIAAWDNDAGEIRLRGRQSQAQQDESNRERRVEKRLGVELQRPTAELAQQYRLRKDVKGMVVTDVRPDSPAARAGLKAGDVIQRVDDKRLDDFQDLDAALHRNDGGLKEVRLQIQRDGSARDVVVRP
jgi:PDZ domain/Wzt C-terminal domain